MSNLTKEKALELTLKHWKIIRSDIENAEYDAFDVNWVKSSALVKMLKLGEIRHDEFPMHHCFCCEFADQNETVTDFTRCDNCPMLGFWGSDSESAITQCLDENSPYAKISYAETRDDFVPVNGVKPITRYVDEMIGCIKEAIESNR